jgi:hypothetical protein
MAAGPFNVGLAVRGCSAADARWLSAVFYVMHDARCRVKWTHPGGISPAAITLADVTPLRGGLGASVFGQC